MQPAAEPRHPSFVVALPMYNEQDYAEACVRALFPVLDSVDLPNAVLAVNDGSTDDTLGIVRRLQLEYTRLHLVDHEVNRGYGAAIRSAYGFAAQRAYDYVLFMDADLTQDPRYIREFLPYMVDGVDVIKASRYVGASRVIGVSRDRVVVSSLGNSFARLAFHLPITDYTNGFRALRTATATRFDLKENSFAILVEEMWQAKHVAKTFADVSYSLTARTNAADSKFNYNLRVYRDYLKYCLYSLAGIRPRLRPGTGGTTDGIS